MEDTNNKSLEYPNNKEIIFKNNRFIYHNSKIYFSRFKNKYYLDAINTIKNNK